jgi:thioredoxin reductase
MAIDTPAKLAILGAGPIGLEAALYARFLGYDVLVLEQGEICQHVCQWGHVPMFSPFAQLHSALGLAAIKAQDENYRPPALEAFLTGQEWLEQYLLPLAGTDLLSDQIATGTTVRMIGKEQVLKTDRNTDLPEGDERGDWSFRIYVIDKQGQERIELVDGVLDCTGVYSHPNYAGHGGVPALGELGLARQRMEYHLPNILGADRERYAGNRTLLIGDGMSAATAAIWLSQLEQQAPGTKFTWITRHEQEPGEGPIRVIENDPLSQRARDARRANEIAWQSRYWHWGTHLERVECLEESGRFAVTLSGRLAGEHQFDTVLALVGYRANLELAEELQLSLDPITGGIVDPLNSVEHAEAHFFQLGSKSFGRNSDFLFTDGLNQIRQVFALLGDRPTLDLYATRPKLR